MVSGRLARLEKAIPALRRYAAAMVRDRRVADRLVRDCLIGALGGLADGSGEDSELRLRLFTMVHQRLVVRERRSRGRPGSGGNTQTDPLIGAFGRLPFAQRSVVYLVSVEELSYHAVATVLAIPISRVLSLLAEGREGLRQIMGGTASTPAGGSHDRV